MRRLLDLLGRVALTRAEVAALALLSTGALLALALLWVLQGQPSLIAAPAPSSPAGPAPSPSLAVATPSEAPLVVHVTGLVRRPGLVTLPAGSRVADALEAAGGPRPRASLESLNLARLVSDGEQLVVTDGRAPAPAPPAGGAAADAAPPAPKVSLNSATVADLETLPGIGPVLAERIVSHRDSIGGFTQISELNDVSGIGEKTFQAIAPLVTL